ncbi:carboxylating nicotinate-nucleotide diphosphorylase [Massiliimalia massiliensis]|uniref:carboxylating nicotinate-nucleotide diphosphorylase n=1 Tax=Massiliimalia massiliensis TaxID=1852384 RepID=UPI000984C8DA|nr:carboxylating nicotinate-nucleotide diphosphorylase [Massiliimalia massiliensis]
MELPLFYIDDLIKRALQEDINYIDVTTDYLIDDDSVSNAKFLAKDSGIVCGIDIAMRVFTLLDDTLQYTIYKKDGEPVQKGDIIVTFTGKTKAMLKGERTALNLIQHMSGIATATRKCVDLTAGTNAAIACTRKTMPGLRPIQKYAVVVGGGRNHRYNLSDAAMLKDNHIDAYGGITGAVNALRARTGHMVMIEVETRNLDEVQEALDCGCNVIMLDNMDYAAMAKAVEMAAGRAKLEASGNITLDNIADVAKTGVDIISLGALTHSVKCFDISMKIEK